MKKKVLEILLNRAVIKIKTAQRIPYHRRMIMTGYNELVNRADKLATKLSKLS